MQEFRAKKEAGEAVKANGDEKVVELKQTYGDFHYRQYKESTADDEETKKTHLSNAITAGARAFVTMWEHRCLCARAWASVLV